MLKNLLVYKHFIINGFLYRVLLKGTVPLKFTQKQVEYETLVNSILKETEWQFLGDGHSQKIIGA